MNARDELAALEELDGHKPTHREYKGGWWELACSGCDFALGRRLSHLDWEPHNRHRADVFNEAILAAGYTKPRTVTTVEELEALPENTVIRDSEPATLQFMDGAWQIPGSNTKWSHGNIDLPVTVLFTPAEVTE